MGSMYTETAYINGGAYLFWDSFEWFCLQISSEAKYFSSLVQGLIVAIV